MTLPIRTDEVIYQCIMFLFLIGNINIPIRKNKLKTFFRILATQGYVGCQAIDC